MAADGFKGFAGDSLQEAASNINRRTFIERTLLAIGAALLQLPTLLPRKIEYLDEISPNYRAWREAQIEIVKQGYTIRSASLERPVGGFRRARVHVKDETGIPMTLIWLQPWCAEESS